MPERLPAAFRCEDDERGALMAAAQTPAGAGIGMDKSASLSMRWRRSSADGLLITPGVSPGRAATPDQVAWVSMQAGGSPDNEGSRPPPQWRVHRDIYRQRPGVGAIVQARAVFSTTLACTARIQQEGIPAFHPGIALAGGDSIRCAADADPESQALSDPIGAAMKDRAACLIAGHGLLATGATLQAAMDLCVEIETLARIYWQILQIGEPAPLSPKGVRRLTGGPAGDPR